MKVNLAGYNIDCSLIGQISGIKAATPETISAAYARISRSPKSVEELRKISIEEVENSRESNENIIYEMGHSSIAEHAVFNFDLIGVSRYLTETIQKSRLASFTEKSQRYVTLKGDFLVPQEIKETILEKEFRQFIKELHLLYNEIYEQGKIYLEKTGFSGKLRELQGRAKEDARYILPLSTLTQMGMTINARNLERLLRRLHSCPMVEAHELREKIITLVKSIAPSLIKYTERDEQLHSLIRSSKCTKHDKSEDSVSIVRYSNDGDDQILAALLYESADMDFNDIAEILRTTSQAEKEALFAEIFKGMKAYNSLPRAFEMADCTFEIKMSSSCFAQLKRHRMSTIIKSLYNPADGYVIPPLLMNFYDLNQLRKAIDTSNELFYKLENFKTGLGAYALLNAHKVRVVFKANLRELYHFSRLRSDQHAQWEIRDISHEMDKLLREKFPFAASMIMGKDEFNEYSKR